MKDLLQQSFSDYYRNIRSVKFLQQSLQKLLRNWLHI